MRFTSAIFAGLVAVAYAQDATSSVEAVSTSSAVDPASTALSPEQAAEKACLDACAAGDVGCQALCKQVPNPSDQDVINNTACAAECDQGDGSEADTNAFAACIQACIDEFYYDDEGTPSGSTNNDSGSSSGSDSTDDSSSGSDSTDDSSSDDASSDDSSSGSDDDSSDSNGDSADDSTDGDDSADDSTSEDAEDGDSDDSNSGAASVVSGAAFGLVAIMAAVAVL